MGAYLAFVLTVCAAGGGGGWTAPSQPDPRAILREAEDDARHHRYAAALAKHLWFHHNALRYAPSLSGFRVSFALADWRDLGEAYPPALVALRQERDDAIARFRQETPGGLQDFHDFVAINDILNERTRTIAVFKVLDQRNAAAAAQVFTVARESLVRAKEYVLCGKYLKPSRDWGPAVKAYRWVKAEAKEGRLVEFIKLHEQILVNETATIIFLLVVNQRQAEADQLALDAKREWDDPAFHAAIDSALRGVVPEPLPEE